MPARRQVSDAGMAPHHFSEERESRIKEVRTNHFVTCASKLHEFVRFRKVNAQNDGKKEREQASKQAIKK